MEDFRRYREWHYDLSVNRITDEGDSFVSVLATVRFPVSDYAAMLGRLKAWNADPNALAGLDPFTREVRRQRLERERAEP
jgi:hypothetical protein